MTDYYPLSIVVHGVALNITVQSHVDKICFGLIACRRAVPDVHELGQQVERAMALLRKLVAAPVLAAPAAAPSAGNSPDESPTRAPRPRAPARKPRRRAAPAAPAGASAAAPAVKPKRRNGAARRTAP